jgi:twitching motility protein PilT
VVGKSLLPRIGGGRIAAYEILVVTPAIRSLIRQNKSYQIPGMMQTSRRQGMQLLDDALADLVRQQSITLDHALEAANDPTNLGNQFGM